MVFSSNVFLFLFLPIFLGLYYLSGQRYRNLLLLIASYIFYAWWRVDFLALFIGVAGAALVLALLLGFILSWSLIGPPPSRRRPSAEPVVTRTGRTASSISCARPGRPRRPSRRLTARPFSRCHRAAAEQALARRERSVSGTVLTSWRGVLQPAASGSAVPGWPAPHARRYGEGDCPPSAGSSQRP